MADKALLLGINNYKNVNALRGCVNDVEGMRRLLTEVLGFDAKNVRAFTDEKVVKDEVQKQMKWLFRDAAAGDRVIFHFSGHGTQVPDLDGDEDDGADEAICLWDMDFNDDGSYFTDEELRRWTEQLPTGVHLTVVLDNCHSGTGTRLLVAPQFGASGATVHVRVDDKTTLRRSLAGRNAGRAPAPMGAADLADRAAELLDPANPDVVRVRYVDPPQAVKDEIARLARKAAQERRRPGTRVRARPHQPRFAGGVPG